ncbi:MAG TPA: beta-ketoacyl-ACP synthase II [Candidatus Ornithospirochaeta stercorigallinarum]|nr:beta-ketoacyl-ACP synthase II [Candidatus Ornithospirochaeta stercorigallinarum]
MENYRRVVVTGMGAISPVGKGVEENWRNLVDGVNGIDEITLFDTTDFKAKLDGEVKDFNPRDYMDKSDVLKTDRYAQFAIAAAKEAVEMSNIIGSVDPERLAVYFGTGIGGMATFVKEHNTLLKRGPGRVSPFFVPMMIANMSSGLISIRYNAQGPAMPAVTACASGTNAIGEAMRLIRHGYADAVIAGGSEAAICECGVAGFINMQALSTATDRNAASLPFDKRRSGFVIAEGGAALILEEYEHAKKRGAAIYAELVGYGSTSDAYHITAPRADAEGARRAMSQALQEAGYSSDDSVYVNAHGTGTPLNDKAETLAIKHALGEEAARKAVISSTKSMTGHMLGAAGALEAIVSIKALETGIIPPTINLLEKDEECDLDYAPLKAVRKDITLAISNSLGFGGHNGCLAFRRV